MNSVSEDEKVVGDPWAVLPIKTRKYAKESIPNPQSPIPNPHSKFDLFIIFK